MQEEQFTDEFLFLCENRLKRFVKNTKHFFPLQIFFQTAVADAENASPTEYTTPHSKQMLWQSAGTQRPETSHRCKRKRWQLWMLW